METQEKKRRKSKAGAGSWRKLKDGRWRHQFTLQNGKRKDVYGFTQAECKAKRRELEEQAAGGRDVSKRDQTLADYLADWLTFFEGLGKAPATVKSYRQNITAYIVPALGNVRLSKLTAKQIDELLMTIRRRGNDRTAQITRGVLSKALGQAVRWDMVPRNVARLTEPVPVAKKDKLPLAAPQLATLIEATRSERHGPLFAVAIGTGMRQEELFGLHWSDVNLDAGYLDVRQALRKAEKGYELGPTKTPKSRRRIELPEFAVSALREQRAQQRADAEWNRARWEDTGLVFTNTVGRALNQSNVNEALHDALDAAGLPRQTFHDLRHAAATLMAANGVAPNVARDVLGHADIRMTLNVYTHANRDSLRHAASAIDAALGLEGSTPRALKKAG